MASLDNARDLMDLLKQDNIDYFLVAVTKQRDDSNKIDIFSSYKKEELKELLKLLKIHIKENEDNNKV